MKLTKEYKDLLRLGAPVAVTQLGVLIVSFADTMMVGAYGTDELAAAAFVNSLFLTPAVMLIGFAGGITPLVGTLFGKKEHGRIAHTWRKALRINIIMAALFSLIMGAIYFFLPAMGQEPQITSLARPYYLITLAGLIPMAIFNSCQQMSNGITDTAMPMWIMISCNILNIIGNYVLIFGNFGFPELGLTGAGISTITSRIIGAVAILIISTSTRRYRPFTHASGNPEPGLRKLIWRTSYPLMIQSGVECFLWTFGAIECGWFGKIQLAAYQIVNVASQIAFMSYLSIGAATAIRVANKLGASDIDGVRATASAALHINIALCTIACIIYLIASQPILQLFTSDKAVIANALLLITPLLLYQYCDATQVTIGNAQRGTSVVSPLLWISLISYLGVGIPLALLLGKTLGMGNIGVYYSFSGALATAAILLVFIFKKTLRSIRVNAV